MNIAITAAVSITMLMLMAALFVVWARRETWLRTLAIPLALLAAAVSTATIGSTLGHAVPLINGVTAPSGDFTVLSAKLVIDDGIYITLDLPGPPRLYWLPWDKKMAESIEEMLNQGEIKATLPPFEFSWDTNAPQFLPLPQPKWMPDKEDAPAAPHFGA